MHLFLCMAAGLVLAGCGEKSGQPASATNTPSSGGNPLTAPVDYLGAVAKGKQRAEKVVDTASLQKAIQMFNVDQGRNPTNLDELVQQKYMPALPNPPYGTRLDYDATSGRVKVVSQ